ncbi:M15 family metallopeptidase [Shewanella youngdeokensis]|uniref:M15 family metallopeptidase n=1 Tax=Shewanella youngdeokensis TaxID=2999068 RepID=A0ABZ0JTW2_9GAMM|nr:M15 family metallopeptidase [Shewanella sp. DAU334]
MPIVSPHLYGLSSSHLVDYTGHLLEQQTAMAFEKMRIAAKVDGIDIAICSAYRSFERQQSIWNAKANGKRVILDKHSQPIDISTKTATEIIDLILIWSALPGTSRHHWGTDIDIFDAKQISKQELQLISPEYQQNGPCFALSQWLATNAQLFGFYLPFQTGFSGVTAEPWHLSYYPVAQGYLDNFNVESLREVLDKSAVVNKASILPKLISLTQEYVYRIAPIPL